MTASWRAVFVRGLVSGIWLWVVFQVAVQLRLWYLMDFTPWVG